MLQNLEILYSIFIILVGTCIFLLFVFFAAYELKKKIEKKRAPFADMKRPPGESLRQKIENLDDKINDRIFTMSIITLLIVIFVLQAPFQNFSSLFTIVFVGSLLFAIVGFGLIDNIKKRHNCRLGWDGERFVGEELSRLVKLGFEIYHDLPCNGFNIDHVIVGTRGIFVVETKTRRKSLNRIIKNECTVVFDGQKLLWPWKTADDFGVKQVMDNAKALSSWIKQIKGFEIEAKPVLTLPGWMVNRTVECKNIWVCNPKEIYGHCAGLAEVLEQTKVEQISKELDKLCKMEVRR